MQPVKFEVTLAALREAGACFSGYNRVVRAIQVREFSDADNERESYIKFSHNEPVAITSILESNGLEDALWALSCVPSVDRDARLFAVWCARQVEHLMTDPRSKAALNVAERFANGEATEVDRDAARDAARAAAWDAAGAAAGAARAAAWAAGAAAGAARAAAWDAAGAAAGAARDAWAAAGAAGAAAGAAAWDAAEKNQKEMLINMCKGIAPWQIKS